MDFSSIPQGTVRLFTFKEIRVCLHWSWLFAALYFFSQSSSKYENGSWALMELFTLFGIVTLHEFGHCFATRQCGGRSDTIVLWPIGGVAYVESVERPAAQLWSVAAGPLVNLVLWPILWVISWFGVNYFTSYSAIIFVQSIFWINTSLLLFNLLPLFPMDGGQMLRALLWFRLGAHKSLHLASLIGLIGCPIVAVASIVMYKSLWIAAIMISNLITCWTVFRSCSEVLPFGVSFPIFSKWQGDRTPKKRMNSSPTSSGPRKKASAPSKYYEPKIKPKPDLAPERKAVEEIDAILDKIARSGMDSLTAEEKAALQKASSKLKDTDY